MGKAINRKMRYMVLTRDNSICQKCSKTIQDGKKLDVYIRKQIKRKEGFFVYYYWTLCNECAHTLKNTQKPCDG